MRPYGGGISSISLTFTSINHEYLFNLSIVVPIIIVKVHLIIYTQTSLNNHCLSIFILTFIIVTTIVFNIIFQLYWPHHVKVQFKQIITLSLKIVGHTTHKPLVGGVAFRVENVIELCTVMSWIEFSVLELHQNDQSFLLTQI